MPLPKETATRSSPASPSFSRSISAIAWVFGVVLTGYLVHRVGAASIAHALERVGSRFVWLVAAYAAATAVGAIPWALLLPVRARPSWPAVVSSRFAASGLSALLPFFGLGEAGRLLWMPRFDWSRGTAAIVVDRLIYLVAGALFLFAAAGSARSLGALPPQLISGAVVVALAILAVSAVVALIAARGQLGRVWNKVLARFAPRRTRAPGAWEPSLRAMLVGPRRTLLAGLAIHLVSRLLFAVEVYAGLRLLGLPSGWRVTAIFAAVPIALSVAGTFIPGQLGLQEGVQALVAAALGIGPAAGLTLVLLQRVRQLLFVPLSGVLIAIVTRGNRGSSRDRLPDHVRLPDES
jgi:uncharacterized membrane protein YbhN (UPF0104 family)